MVSAHVPAPALEMRDDTPVSTAFGDIYFSRSGGIAETQHVFLAGNGLPERWCGARKHFTIGELGFGTGLNFLVAWKNFRETAATDTTLHYIAVEKYPFTPEQLRTLLALQPELTVQAAQLIAAYPLRLPGTHRIHLPQAVLTLHFGDVEKWLKDLPDHCNVNAWFLDGFSPAKNPDMWTEQILTNLTRVSAPDATCATFTAAGVVRRGLQAAGFEIKKIAGFGHKRDMLAGARQVVLQVGLDSVAPPFGGGVENDNSNGCKKTPLTKGGSTKSSHKTILIIGGGIAGATIANALAMRGFAVTVLERNAIASGASGNAAGVLFPQLTKQWNPCSAFSFAAYGFMLRQLTRWHESGLQFTSASPGMLRLPRHADEELQLEMLQQNLGLDPAIVHWLTRDEASKSAGVALTTGAAYFPYGTWICPAELCHALLHYPNISVHQNTAAKSLTRDGNGWAVTLESGEVITAPQVCIASANESATLLADYSLRLGEVGGQISLLAANDVHTPLQQILCRKGYIIPCNHHYIIGATYHREEMTSVTKARHMENLTELATTLPGWHIGKATSGRSSIRATTPDRQPYIGAVDAGLYISTGHGSRGLLNAPLAAEMIASAMAREVPPINAAFAALTNPLRFKRD